MSDYKVRFEENDVFFTLKGEEVKLGWLEDNGFCTYASFDKRGETIPFEVLEEIVEYHKNKLKFKKMEQTIEVYRGGKISICIGNISLINKRFFPACNSLSDNELNQISNHIQSL